MIRKLKSGKYRLYSKKKDPKTGKRKNLGTFNTREEAKKHERQVQFFKRKCVYSRYKSNHKTPCGLSKSWGIRLQGLAFDSC